MVIHRDCLSPVGLEAFDRWLHAIPASTAAWRAQPAAHYQRLDLGESVEGVRQMHYLRHWPAYGLVAVSLWSGPVLGHTGERWVLAQEVHGRLKLARLCACPSAHRYSVA